MNKFNGLAIFFGSVALAVVTPIAYADHHDGRDWDRGHFPHHDYRRDDFPRWHEGHWHHGYHEGWLGWWWVVAGAWYFYTAPVYPIPEPTYPATSVIIQQTPAPPAPAASSPPPAQNWYYCSSSRNYYPYVNACPEGWKIVPATPPDISPK